MKINYIMPCRFPTKRAYGIATDEMCNSFLENGVDVHIYSMDFSTNNKKIKYSLSFVKCFYPFKKIITKLKITPIAFLYAKKTFVDNLITKDMSKNDICYTRDIYTAVRLKKKGYQVYLELHSLPTFFRKLQLKNLNLLDGLILINTNIAKDLLLLNPNCNKQIIAPSGFTPQKNISKKKKLLKYKIPNNKKIVVYTGSFQKWKGVDFLLSVAKKNPLLTFVFAGGEFTHQTLENVISLGVLSQDESREVQLLADVLALPNRSGLDISAKYTSPIKLFEYCSCSIPVIASNLPSIKSTIDEGKVFYFEPDSVDSCTSAINSALGKEGVIRSLAAYKYILNFTWDKRAKKVISFIHHSNTTSSSL